MTRQIRLRQSATTRAFASVALGMILFISLSVVLPIKDHSQAAHSKRAGLSFEERVAAQRAIEEVYWQHRIWPKEENPQPKPLLDEVMPESVIRAKVEDYLRQSNALEQYWQRPITAEQLQAEIERMARQTKQLAVLRELWAALRDDPLVVAECLARPLLAERLMREQEEQAEGRRPKAETATIKLIDPELCQICQQRNGTIHDQQRHTDHRHRAQQRDQRADHHQQTGLHGCTDQCLHSHSAQPCARADELESGFRNGWRRGLHADCEWNGLRQWRSRAMERQ